MEAVELEFDGTNQYSSWRWIAIFQFFHPAMQLLFQKADTQQKNTFAGGEVGFIIFFVLDLLQCPPGEGADLFYLGVEGKFEFYDIGLVRQFEYGINPALVCFLFQKGLSPYYPQHEVGEGMIIGFFLDVQPGRDVGQETLKMLDKFWDVLVYQCIPQRKAFGLYLKFIFFYKSGSNIGKERVADFLIFPIYTMGLFLVTTTFLWKLFGPSICSYWAQPVLVFLLKKTKG